MSSNCPFQSSPFPTLGKVRGFAKDAGTDGNISLAARGVQNKRSFPENKVDTGAAQRTAGSDKNKKHLRDLL